MAFTKRKAILDELTYRLGMIRRANGYEGDIFTSVRQRDLETEPFMSDELPAVNVIPGSAQVDHMVGFDEHQLPVTIEIHTSSAVTSDAAETLLGDIASCVNQNESWGGYADGTGLDAHEIDITQTGDVIQAGTVEIKIYYTTDRGAL